MANRKRDQKPVSNSRSKGKAVKKLYPLPESKVKQQLKDKSANRQDFSKGSADKQAKNLEKGISKFKLQKPLVSEVNESAEAKNRKKQLENTAKPRPMPVTQDCFPAEIFTFIQVLAALSNSYISYSAACVYMLLSNLLSRFFTIQPDSDNPNYIIVPNQSGVLVGPPSIKKSPVIESILKPVYEFLEQLAASFKLSAEELMIFNRKKKLLIDKANKKIAEALELAEENPIEAEKLENEAKEFIRQANPSNEYEIHRHLIVSNCTAMGLASVVDESNIPLIVVQDELGNVYKETLAAGNKKKEVMIGLMDGTSPENYVNANRVYETRYKKVSIIGATPTDTLNAFKGAVNDGFIIRFTLIALPDPKAIKAKQIPNEAKKVGLSAWNQLIGTLVRQVPTELVNIKFSEKAEKKFDAISSKFEERIESEATSQQIKSLLGKRPTFVASIALVNAFARYGFDLKKLSESRVMLKDLELASKYADVIESHFAVAFGVHGNLEEQQALELLNRLLASKFATAVFTASQIAKNEWSGFKDPKVVETLLLVLREYELVRIVSNSLSGSKGGRPTRKWAVVNELLED